MDKYIVSISNQKIEVWAKNHQDAMKKAIRTETKTPKVIASLSGCLKHDDHEDNELLFSIEYMQNNGYFKGTKYEPVN